MRARTGIPLSITSSSPPWSSLLGRGGPVGLPSGPDRRECLVKRELLGFDQPTGELEHVLGANSRRHRGCLHPVRGMFLGSHSSSPRPVARGRRAAVWEAVATAALRPSRGGAQSLEFEGSTKVLRPAGDASHGDQVVEREVPDGKAVLGRAHRPVDDADNVEVTPGQAGRAAIA